MKKFILFLLCLFGIGMTNAEEVNIGLIEEDGDDTYVYLKILPGYFFLDNNPVIYNNAYYRDSNEVGIYDYDFTPSTIHFNCESFVWTIDIVDCRFTTFKGDDVPLTQCFFNNDALYEGIACDVEIMTDEWGGESSSYNNYRVINQNGDVLYTFEVPEGYEYYTSPGFYRVSDDIIIVRIDYKNNNDKYKYCTCWYSLKVGQTSSLAPIKQIHEMKLEANLVTKGDNLIITVGEDSLKTSILVTSLSGMNVKEFPVMEGKAVVSTSDLASGLYLVSQKGGASAKFIVK